MPPHACHGKFKILLVVKSENVAHRSAGAYIEIGEQSSEEPEAEICPD